MPDKQQRSENRSDSEETIVNEAGVATSASSLPERPPISGPTPVTNESTSPTSSGNTPEPKSPGLGTAGPPV